MVATVRTVDAVEALITDNVTGLDTPQMVRDLAETLGALPPTVGGVTTTTPRVLLITDRACCIEMNLAGANQVSIPTNASVAFPIGTMIAVYQMGAGQTTIAAVTPGTTTVRTSSSATTRAQFSTAFLRKRATDEWVLSGELT